MSHAKKTRLAALTTGTLSGALLLAVPAQGEEVPMDKVEQAVQYRQNVMSSLGGLTGTIVGQLRDGFGFGPELAAVADYLVAATADIPSLFPEGTDFGETDAKTEVWSDRAGFAEQSEEMADAAEAFAEAVASGDKQATFQAFKAVGDGCKGCHETYRKE